MNKTPRSILIVALIAAAFALVLVLRRSPNLPEPVPSSGKLVVRFLDIGQGDAELLQLPDGETILIDSGDRGASTVEQLRRYGVKRIELIIATHPHSDHIGEMRDVMRAFNVLEFWDSGFNHPTKTYGDMLQDIRDRGIKFATPKRGDLRRLGDVLVEVLNPFEELPDENPNNASVVVRLTFGSKRFLFAGDSEYNAGSRSSAWEKMLEEEKQSVQADLLKAAHHGSSNGTSREVLEAVRPSIVTISCAAGNDYHHPHPKVMTMLEESADKIKLYRTDLEGTITAVCDGNTIEMSTEKQVARDRLYLTGDEVTSTVATVGANQGGKAKRAR